MKLAEAKRLMRDDLKRSDLTEKDMFVVAALKDPHGLACAGYYIHYPEPVTGERKEFARFKYLSQPEYSGFAALSKKKPRNYTQPPNTAPQAYFSKGLPWVEIIAIHEHRLLIVEGEKKAACACKSGIIAVGLGGVWNFKTKTSVLIDDLAQINWDGRIVYICYDSDRLSNSDVLSAESALAEELLRRGAHVYVVKLPTLELGQKTGADDFLVAEAKEEFNKLVDAAEEWAASKVLHELNKKLVYVHNHSIYELSTRQKIDVAKFKNEVYADWIFYKPVPIKRDPGKMQECSAAKEWVRWPGRAIAPRYVYEPGEPPQTADGSINEWSGWGIAESLIKPGFLEPWHELLEIQFTNPFDRKYFEQWLAYPLQYPGAKMAVAVLNWGTAQGTGKDLVGVTMERIYGENAIKIKESDIDQTHNEQFQNKQFIRLEEFTGGGGHGRRTVSSDQFKTLVTQEKITINPKFLRPYSVRDCANYYVTSNHADAIHLEPADRRWFVNEVTNPAAPPAFYATYGKWLQSSGAGALFYYLLQLDLTGFDPNAPAPATAAKRLLIGGSQSEQAYWAATLRDDPDRILIDPLGGPPLNLSLVLASELEVIYKKEFPNSTRPVMHRVMQESGLHQANAGNQVRYLPEGWGKLTLWIVRNHAQLRKATEKEIAEVFKKERGQKSIPAEYRSGRPSPKHRRKF
jgi:hypothetical protein